MATNNNNRLRIVETDCEGDDGFIKTPFVKAKGKSSVRSWEDTKNDIPEHTINEPVFNHPISLDKKDTDGKARITNLNSVVGNLYFPLHVSKKALKNSDYQFEVLTDSLLRLNLNPDISNSNNITSHPLDSFSSPFISDIRFLNADISACIRFQHNTDTRNGIGEDVIEVSESPINLPTYSIDEFPLVEKFNNRVNSLTGDETFGKLLYRHYNKILKNGERNCYKLDCDFGEDAHVMFPSSIIMNFIHSKNQVIPFLSSSRRDEDNYIFKEELSSRGSYRSGGLLNQKYRYDKTILKNVTRCMVEGDFTKKNFIRGKNTATFSAEIQKIWDEILVVYWLRLHDVLNDEALIKGESHEDCIPKFTEKIRNVIHTKGFYYDLFASRLKHHYDEIELVDVGNGINIPFNQGTTVEGLSANYLNLNAMSLNKQFTGDKLIFSFNKTNNYDMKELTHRVNSWRNKAGSLVSMYLDSSETINDFLNVLLQSEPYYELFKLFSVRTDDLVSEAQTPHKVLQQTVINNELKIIDNQTLNGVSVGDFVRQLM